MAGRRWGLVPEMRRARSGFGGARLDTIADMLGHSSTDVTRLYAKIVDRMAENAARYLEAVLVAYPAGSTMSRGLQRSAVVGLPPIRFQRS